MTENETTIDRKILGNTLVALQMAIYAMGYKTEVPNPAQIAIDKCKEAESNVLAVLSK